MKGKKKIKVDKSVTPIHFSKRKQFEIEVLGNYFVSFGNNDAYPCTVLEFIKDGSEPKSILIEMDLGHEKSSHYVKVDEIGRTPEEAVINTVTS